MTECVIVGGGVIGLSLAWQLAVRGRRVRVIDRQEVGREASWAGAGILPPASRAALAHPLDQLRGLSFELHREWADQLRAETGIDTGYRRCGGIYLARSAGETAALSAWAATLGEEGVRVERLMIDNGAAPYPGPLPVSTRGEGVGVGPKPSRLNAPPDGSLSGPEGDHLEKQRAASEKRAKSLLELEREIVIKSADAAAVPIRSAWLLPDECQVRNPHYLQALARACELRGVTLSPNHEVQDFVLSQGRVAAVITSQGVIAADQVCVTSGAWTGQLLQRLGMTLGVVPIRGQMVLFRCPSPPVTHVINEGPRYIVPRADGRLLVGSTEEEAGFEKRTTEAGIAELIAFAHSLLPVLKSAEIEQTWAGLRPGSFDGFPYLGAIPGLTNGFVAAGHYRSGLYLSPGTATVMSELMCGERSSLDLSVFCVGR